MKKLVLGLLALSAVSFAASNPGDNAESAGAKPGPTKTADVGVPMEVRINILPSGGRLVLVDENNKLIDRLEFNHGDIIKGAATADSIVEKEVRLKRDDNQAFGGAYKVNFAAKNTSDAKVSSGTDFILDGHGSASGKKLKSSLEYRDAEITLTGTEKEVMTKVRSKIAATDINAVESTGLYVGTGRFEASVKNK